MLAHLNPWKLHDLQCVLEMRCYGDLLSDVDLKEVYFQQLWGFEEKDFLLANWREMSVNAMRIKVREAYQFDEFSHPEGPGLLDSLQTKEEIVRAFRELTYVPLQVVSCASNGARVLLKIKGLWASEEWLLLPSSRLPATDLEHACRAGLRSGTEPRASFVHTSKRNVPVPRQAPARVAERRCSRAQTGCLDHLNLHNTKQHIYFIFGATAALIRSISHNTPQRVIRRPRTIKTRPDSRIELSVNDFPRCLSPPLYRFGRRAPINSGIYTYIRIR